MRKNYDFSIWVKSCPDCNIKMYYSNKYKLNYGIKSNSVCKECKYKKISHSLTNKKLSDKHKQSLELAWKCRKKNYSHPMLGKHHSAETIKKMCISKQSNPPFLGKHHSAETKMKISESNKLVERDYEKLNKLSRLKNKGSKHTDLHKSKISNALKGKIASDETKTKIKNKIFGLKRSDETKEKLRNVRIIQIKKLGGGRNYNPIACKFIDEYGKQNGYNFQHALNGGEVILNGYFVDGYDKEKNVIFEYDEPKHEYSTQKRKDFHRQNYLIKKNGCKIIRYSEKYNKIYESFPIYSNILL